MKTGGIVVCSTLVALVYIPEKSYGRSVTHTLRPWPLTARVGVSKLFDFLRVDSIRTATYFYERIVAARLPLPSLMFACPFVG